MRYINLLGYNIVDVPPDILISLCEKKIEKKEKLFIVTLNSLILLHSIINRDFSIILKRADLIIPDGAGIILASKIFGIPIKNKIPGIEFMQELLKLAYKRNFSVFLLGAKKKVVNDLFVKLKKWYENINFVGKYYGFFNKKEEKKVIEGINKVTPDILFVGMGSPLQEEFIYNNYHILKSTIMIGVGGSFDVLSGYKKRAPLWFRKNNIEWLYRSFTSIKKFLNIFKLILFVIIIIFLRIKYFLLKKKN